MILRLITTLLISAFIFANSTVTFGLIFLLITVCFSIIFKSSLSGKFLKFVISASITVVILQMLFRKGDYILYALGPIKFYLTGLYMGLNVATVFLSTLFIIGILGTVDPDVIFHKMEAAHFPRVIIFPLYTAYRFLPAITIQARVMNHYATIRSNRGRAGFFSKAKLYSSLLTPFFVGVFKRIFYMWLSVERRNIESVDSLFAKKSDRTRAVDFIYLFFALISIIAYFRFGGDLI